MIKTCEICKVEFKTVHPNYKYCSEECSKEAIKEADRLRTRDKRKKITNQQREVDNQRRREHYIKASKESEPIRECTICNKEYKLSEEGAGYKYCSKDCFDEVRRVRNKERWREQNPDWDKGTNKICEWCGQPYEVLPGYSSLSRFCSDKCQQAQYSREVRGHVSWEEHTEEIDKQKQERQLRLEEERMQRLRIVECQECGKTFETFIPNQLTCSTECSRQRSNRLSWQNKEVRYNDTNLVDRDISIRILYKRDKGICYICGGECDFEDHAKTNGYFTVGPTYPSIDHLIPIARGGMHAWDNVKLAHHRCNSLKSDILPSELGLDIDIDDAYALARKVSPRKKGVKQYSKDGKLIGVYESTTEAERQTRIPASTIQNSARGESKMPKHGFIFKYI